MIKKKVLMLSCGLLLLTFMPQVNADVIDSAQTKSTIGFYTSDKPELPFLPPSGVNQKATTPFASNHSSNSSNGWLQVARKQLSEYLPQTGEASTWYLSLIGLDLVLLIILLFIVKKQKNEE